MNNETQRLLNAIARRVTTSLKILSGTHSLEILPSAGDRRSKIRGDHGLDVVSLSDYEPGDDVRTIDWDASAAEGRILVRQVYEPRDKRIVVLSDSRESLEFGTQRTTKKLLGAEILLTIARSAARSRDRLSFTSYNQDGISLSITARSPETAALQALVHLIEGERVKGGRAQRSGLVKSLSLLSGRRSIVFVLSDFVLLSGEELTWLKRTASRHDVVCMWLQDLRERELPDSYGPIVCEDASTGALKTFWLSPWSKARTRSEYARDWQTHAAATRKALESAHCRVHEFSTETSAEEFAKKLARVFAGM